MLLCSVEWVMVEGNFVTKSMGASHETRGFLRGLFGLFGLGCLGSVGRVSRRVVSIARV